MPAAPQSNAATRSRPSRWTSPGTASPTAPDRTAEATNASADFVVVAYETPELVERCLRSVLEQPADRPGSVLLVDNSPSATTADLAREKFPGVRVLRPGNVGFGPGANLGIVATADGAPFVAVLNGDTELCDGALAALVDDLLAQRRAAIAGPRLVFPDGRPQSSVGRFPTLLRVLLEQSGAWRLLAALPGGSQALPLERQLYASLARHLRLHGPDRHLVRLRPVVALTAGAHLAREAARSCTRDSARRRAERAAVRAWASVVADAWHGWRRR